MTPPVDIVFTYVNSSDPEWKRLFTKRMHGLEHENDNRRFRDLNTIMYALRGVEKFMPWISNVYFVVQGGTQIPKWLNLLHPRLKVVFHDEFIPKEYLPTFNSNVIEMFVHRLEGLSENFILANDDMIAVKPLKQEDYFRDGIPVFKKVVQSEDYHLQNNGVFKNILFNNTSLEMKYLNTTNRIQLRHYHLFNPYRLSFWNKVFNRLEKDILSALQNSPMRTRRNINHWLISDLQMMEEGASIDDQSLNMHGYFAMRDDRIKNDVFTIIRKSNVICLNDCIKEDTFIAKNARDVLDTILQEKSSFEV